MAPKEAKISKQAAAGITRHITFTIPETLETIRKHGRATCHSVIIAEYNNGLLTVQTSKKITCTKLGH
jgi:hypothetical protein